MTIIRRQKTFFIATHLLQNEQFKYLFELLYFFGGNFCGGGFTAIKMWNMENSYFWPGIGEQSEVFRKKFSVENSWFIMRRNRIEYLSLYFGGKNGEINVHSYKKYEIKNLSEKIREISNCEKKKWMEKRRKLWSDIENIAQRVKALFKVDIWQQFANDSISRVRNNIFERKHARSSASMRIFERETFLSKRVPTHRLKSCFFSGKTICCNKRRI